MKWRLRIRIYVEEQHTEVSPWVEGIPCMDASMPLKRNDDLHFPLAAVGPLVGEYLARAFPTAPGTHVHVGPPPVQLVGGRK